jgi:hypothetical protein
MRIFTPLISSLLAGALQAGDLQAPLTIEGARRAIQMKIEGETVDSVGPVSLSGFNFYREVDLGNLVRLIVVSANIHGGLLAFRRDGSALGTMATDEITWIMLADLDGDGMAEVFTEEIDGRGTGLLSKCFCLYGVDASGIRRLWKGESYYRSQPWNPGQATARSEERDGFLRVDDNMVTYLSRETSGRMLRQLVLEMKGGRIREITKQGR